MTPPPKWKETRPFGPCVAELEAPSLAQCDAAMPAGRGRSYGLDAMLYSGMRHPEFFKLKFAAEFKAAASQRHFSSLLMCKSGFGSGCISHWIHAQLQLCRIESSSCLTPVGYLSELHPSVKQALGSVGSKTAGLPWFKVFQSAAARPSPRRA